MSGESEEAGGVTGQGQSRDLSAASTPAHHDLIEWCYGQIADTA